MSDPATSSAETDQRRPLTEAELLNDPRSLVPLFPECMEVLSARSKTTLYRRAGHGDYADFVVQHGNRWLVKRLALLRWLGHDFPAAANPAA